MAAVGQETGRLARRLPRLGGVVAPVPPLPAKRAFDSATAAAGADGQDGAPQSSKQHQDNRPTDQQQQQEQQLVPEQLCAKRQQQQQQHPSGSRHDPPAISCSAEVLESLPPHLLDHLQRNPPPDTAALLQELRSNLGTALCALPLAPAACWAHAAPCGAACAAPRARQVPWLPVGPTVTGAAGVAWPQLLLPRISAWPGEAPPQPSAGAASHAPAAAAVAAGGHDAAAQPVSTAAALHLAVMEQLDAIGWETVVALSQDLQRLVLQLQDGAGRPHLLRVLLPSSFPLAAPSVSLDLPEPFRFSWGRGRNTLAALVQHAQQALSRYQQLWAALDDLDASCRTLDPPPARTALLNQAREWVDAPIVAAATAAGEANPGGGWYARCGRRLALPKGAGCLELVLSPAAPSALPSATFSGGGAAAAELQGRWFARAPAVWSKARGVAANAAAALELTEFPPPGRQQLAALSDFRRPLPAIGAADAAPQRSQVDGGEQEGADGQAVNGEGSEAGDSSDDSDEEEDEGACGICYALLLRDPAAGADQPGEVPDASCDAAGGCGRPFHSRCLAEWLRGLRDSRRCFATLFGQCPYCSAPVAVKT